MMTLFVVFSSGLFIALCRNTMSSWRGYGEISSMLVNIPSYTYVKNSSSLLKAPDKSVSCLIFPETTMGNIALSKSCLSLDLYH